MAALWFVQPRCSSKPATRKEISMSVAEGVNDLRISVEYPRVDALWDTEVERRFAN